MAEVIIHHSPKIPLRKVDTAGRRPVALTRHFVAWNENGCTESSNFCCHKYYEIGLWYDVKSKVVTSLVCLGCKTCVPLVYVLSSANMALHACYFFLFFFNKCSAFNSAQFTYPILQKKHILRLFCSLRHTHTHTCTYTHSCTHINRQANSIRWVCVCMCLCVWLLTLEYIWNHQTDQLYSASSSPLNLHFFMEICISSFFFLALLSFKQSMLWCLSLLKPFSTCTLPIYGPVVMSAVYASWKRLNHSL